MGKLRIGFIGGCINNQAGINREDLYYSITSKLLSSNHNEHHIILGNYMSFDQLLNQTKSFIDKKQPNLIYLFVRPFPLMPLQKLIVRYDKAEKKIGYTLHPAFITRQLKWKDELSNYHSSNDFQFAKKSVFGLRDINLLAGVFLGLHHWALKYLSYQLESVNQFCKNQNVKLKIISPPQNPESILANLTCKLASNYLTKYCMMNDLDYININLFSLTHFELDKIHFNIQGHKKLGELIYENIVSDRRNPTNNI